ncbi:MAG: hypothetical protein O7A08_08025 [SAR324 cluster bacterium]|nr:hypothetical protein [SAR324 cluster bacterium]MCZ6532899.1 hypothetical protein [SAR324 cluster bacterium]MCZ6558194.1 hypothetical protein [SAR324 cluster bacterium]MCZ6627906.1 hypothetical protein [SAR324 cluster bacterium]MCZ6644899.1 hypothetical protein [SAR324 cluster bacterium]
MKSQGKTITHEHIERALEKFRRRGGLIKQLPDEIVIPDSMLGGRWGAYEPIRPDGGGSGTHGNLV